MTVITVDNDNQVLMVARQHAKCFIALARVILAPPTR